MCCPPFDHYYPVLCERGAQVCCQLCSGEEFDEVDFVDYFHEVPGINNAETAAVGGEFTFIRTIKIMVYSCGANQVAQIGQKN